MLLKAGTRLGPYEIQAPLGAGGMGEVYRAYDARLDRTVAVKVLPEHLSASAELRVRFEREARAASSLNHPNICTIHDIGSQDGVDFMVMELLDGETLASRIERGPLPLQDLLAVGTQIADALDKAHRRGLTHRDLKPSNIMLTKTGAKLMDFGLAKTKEGLASTSSLTAAPTASSPLTMEGAILGTIPYMAPEQLEGSEADARSDIFALGVVLHEMASGRRAFAGKTQASVIAAVLREDPPSLSEIAPAAPPDLGRLVQACLVKDPDERLQNAHDIKVQLEWIAAGGGEASQDAGASKTDLPPRRAAWVLPVVLLLAAVAGWAVALMTVMNAPPAPREMRFIVTAPPGSTIRGDTIANFSVSPDGSRIAFIVSGTDDEGRIHVRPIDSLVSVPIAGTEGGRAPFWSSDGRYLGFVTDRALMRVAPGAGAPQVVAQIDGIGGNPSWGTDGTIVFNHWGGGPLFAIPESGGEARPVTTIESEKEVLAHKHPSFLPDGRRFLFHSFHKDSEKRAIMVGSLDGAVPVHLIDSMFPAVYIDSGYLLHVRGATLMAQRMSLDPPRVHGEPIVVVEGIATVAVPGNAAFSASPEGDVIVFRSRGATVARTRLVLFGRDGTRIETVAEAGGITVSRSPDDRMAVVDRIVGTAADAAGNSPPSNLYLVDLSRKVQTRLTVESTHGDETPVWSPDGKWIAYASHIRAADAMVLIRPASGTGEPREVPVDGRNPHPHDWSPDGDHLIVHVTSADGDLDMMVVPVEGGGGEKVAIPGGYDECQGQFSPDGRWIAFTSELSGTKEVYVRSWPGGDQQWQISSAGGHSPRWRRDGGELYYIAADGTMMAVSVDTQGSFQASSPVPLFAIETVGEEFYFYGGGVSYAPDAEGKRFLVNEVLERPRSGPLQVITNWRPLDV